MKYFFLLAISTALAFGIYSCSKDKAAGPAVLNPCDSTKVGFSKVAPIFTANCALSGCHDAASHIQNYDLTTAADGKNVYGCKSLLDRDGLCNIKQQSGCSPMPASGKLADSLITLIERWKTDGYCSN